MTKEKIVEFTKWPEDELADAILKTRNHLSEVDKRIHEGTATQEEMAAYENQLEDLCCMRMAQGRQERDRVAHE